MHKTLAMRPTEFAVGNGIIAYCDVETARRFYKPSNDEYKLIINVAARFGQPRKMQDNPLVLSFPMVEYASKHVIDAFKRTMFPEIDKVIQSGERVLIHCEQGQIRSPHLVKLYRDSKKSEAAVTDSGSQPFDSRH